MKMNMNNDKIVLISLSETELKELIKESICEILKV